MSVYEVGRIAVKSTGREAGVHVVVVDIIDRAYVLIDGMKAKRRRCNVKHLVPTPKKLGIEKGAGHEDVVAAINDADMTEKFEKRIDLDL